MIKNSLSGCTTYYFALKTKDAAGNWSTISNLPNAKTACSGSLTVHCEGGDQAHFISEDDLPSVMELGAPWPNPGREVTRLRFGVPAQQSGSPFELSVFDLAGRRVAVLAKGNAQPGRFTAEWRPGTQGFSSVRSGLYFVRFSLGNEQRKRVVVVLQ